MRTPVKKRGAPGKKSGAPSPFPPLGETLITKKLKSMKCTEVLNPQHNYMADRYLAMLNF